MSRGDERRVKSVILGKRSSKGSSKGSQVIHQCSHKQQHPCVMLHTDRVEAKRKDNNS